MTVLCSYDLNGKKLSFANWISNLSPQETPFTSMTGKESIQQTLFQWQTDSLLQAKDNAKMEGEEAEEGLMRSTKVLMNNTQIMGKVVLVSDTANSVANFGRGKEIQYQMEKAGQELKRDIEYAFLNNHHAVNHENLSSYQGGRRTAGFLGLVAPKGAVDVDTGAVVHKNTLVTGKLTEGDIFDTTYNLYLSGSEANVIMFHPRHAELFSAIQEKAVGGNRKRIFENTPKFSVYVSTLIDPLGQEYKLVPNRWMPEGVVYFFNTSDWTQMVLRAPTRVKLAKDGSYEKWMIEAELGLRHKHPFASAVLDVDHTDDLHDKFTVASVSYLDLAGTQRSSSFKDSATSVVAKDNTPLTFSVQVEHAGDAPAGGHLHLMHNGVEFGKWIIEGGSSITDLTVKLITEHANAAKHNGSYELVVTDAFGNKKAVSYPFTIHVE